MAGNRLTTVTTNTTANSKVTVKTDPTELIYLAKTIYGEARGTNHESKVAVGWSIRNRVERKFRGGRYKEVVTAPWQYDAWLKNDPNYREVQHPSSKAAWNDSLDATREVYYAASASNPIPGATHYYSPDAQAQLHKKDPKMYPAVPRFLTPDAIQVPNPSGLSEHDLKFHKNVR